MKRSIRLIISALALASSIPQALHAENAEPQSSVYALIKPSAWYTSSYNLALDDILDLPAEPGKDDTLNLISEILINSSMVQRSSDQKYYVTYDPFSDIFSIFRADGSQGILLLDGTKLNLYYDQGRIKESADPFETNLIQRPLLQYYIAQALEKSGDKTWNDLQKLGVDSSNKDMARRDILSEFKSFSDLTDASCTEKVVKIAADPTPELLSKISSKDLKFMQLKSVVETKDKKQIYVLQDTVVGRYFLTFIADPDHDCKLIDIGYRMANAGP
jgi:hypothetical protein